MEYFAIRAHGSAEFWHKVQMLARLRHTSLGALVTMTMMEALGDDLALLDDLAASNVANKLQTLPEGAEDA